MRKSTITNYLIVAAAGAVVAVAAIDFLRSNASSTPTSASTTTIDSLELGSTTETRKENVERIGNLWAVDFAASRGSCEHMTQPLCQRTACRRVNGDKIRNCRPPTSAFRKSFHGAVVREIRFKDHRAVARFSNGEVVELSGAEGNVLVTRIGANALRVAG